MDVSKEPLRIPPIHQSPRDLILAVHDVDVSRQFTILRQQHVPIKQMTLTFSIIGESHIVTVKENGRIKLQEILACISLQNPLHCFHDLKDYRYITEDYGVVVMFSTQPYPMPDGPGIEIIFPKIQGQQPITRIQWQILEDHVKWWTLHTYPDQSGSIYVYTQSQLKRGFNG